MVPISSQYRRTGSLDVHAHLLGGGDDLTAEVVRFGEVSVEQGVHRGGAEDVNAHRRDVRHLLSALGIEAKDGSVHLHRLESIALGLLRKLDDLAGVVDLHETERSGALLVHGHRGDGDVSADLTVLEDEGLVVHAVKVITGEDDVLVALGLAEEPEVLAHRIRGALEPVLVDRALLRSEHLDDPWRLPTPTLLLYAWERWRFSEAVELREAVNLVEGGVDAVGDGDVDEAVVRAEGNRGLRAGLRQGVQTRARATTEDDRQDVVSVIGHLGLILGASRGLGLDGDRAGGAHDLLIEGRRERDVCQMKRVWAECARLLRHE